MKDGLGRIHRLLVLGGTSEIGLAIASALVAERGARHVILAGRDASALQAAGSGLRDAGAQVDTAAFDATALDTHGRMVQAVWETHGDVDVVVAAWGILGDQAELERDPSAAVHVATVDYVAGVSVLLPVADRLEAQGHGQLVVLSSVAGQRGRRSNHVYGSAKAGLDVFAQGLGDRLQPAGVDVLVVRPGFVHTRMTEGLDPAPLSTTPDVVARQVLRGLDRGSHTVYAPPAMQAAAAVLRGLPRGIFRRLPGT